MLPAVAVDSWLLHRHKHPPHICSCRPTSSTQSGGCECVRVCVWGAGGDDFRTMSARLFIESHHGAKICFYSILVNSRTLPRPINLEVCPLILN